MIRKPAKNKHIRYNYKNIIFFIIIIVYFLGLSAGCYMTIKNALNLDFVKSVTGVTDSSITAYNGDFRRFKTFLIRDIIFFLIALLIKYSGILRGLCICLPFVISLQNGAIISNDYVSGLGLFSLTCDYILRNTAASFIFLIYCSILIYDILRDREDKKRDKRTVFIYILSVITIYRIDFLIKNILQNLIG